MEDDALYDKDNIGGGGGVGGGVADVNVEDGEYLIPCNLRFLAFKASIKE